MEKACVRKRESIESAQSSLDALEGISIFQGADKPMDEHDWNDDKGYRCDSADDFLYVVGER